MKKGKPIKPPLPDKAFLYIKKIEEATTPFEILLNYDYLRDEIDGKVNDGFTFR